jgi:hypothetical protein
MGFGRARPFFIWPVGFRGSAAKLYWLLPSCDLIHRSMVKSASGECHGCRVLGISNGDWSLCGTEELASWLMTCSSGMKSGGDSTWKVQGPTLQGEDLRSGLNWLCLVMTLLKALFCERGLFFRWKPKIYDRATTALVHCSLLGGVAFENVGFLVLSWWC